MSNPYPRPSPEQQAELDQQTRELNQRYLLVDNLYQKIKTNCQLTEQELLDSIKYAEDIAQHQLWERRTRDYWHERKMRAERSAERLADPNWDIRKGYINKDKKNEKK
jgi:hypothetical protein